MFNFSRLVDIYSSVKVPTFIIGVIFIIGLWILFSRAGKPGWAAIIPFYNFYVLYKISWGKGLLPLILTFIPYVGFIVMAATMYKLAKCFGKSTVFSILTVLFAPIFILILALDGSRYVGPSNS